jgi:hypothetical protein
MSIAEIRGYTTAHAGGLVENEADKSLCLQPRGSAFRSQVIDVAVKKLVAAVIHDALDVNYPIRSRMMAA